MKERDSTHRPNLHEHLLGRIVRKIDIPPFLKTTENQEHKYEILHKLSGLMIKRAMLMDIDVAKVMHLAIEFIEKEERKRGA